MTNMENNYQDRINAVTKNISTIKNKIAIISGKGGVGKTTISINLAAYLARKYKVALLDADVDCPNVNEFLGIDEQFEIEDDKILPIDKHDIKVVSFASLQEDKEQPVIWRGPMLSNAIVEILSKTNWGEIDYLICDLPPGTSDVPLTIMQILKPEGVIVVTTPQEVSVTDAIKSANMARMLEIPLLGIIENMSGQVFGKGAGEVAAKKLETEFLGRFYLEKEISRSKTPFVLKDSAMMNKFEEIEKKIRGEIK